MTLFRLRIDLKHYLFFAFLLCNANQTTDKIVPDIKKAGGIPAMIETGFKNFN